MDAHTATEARIRAIFQRLFGVDPASVKDDTRRGHLEAWDSLGHLELIVALQSEFGLEIPPDRGLEMETFADVKRIIEDLVTV